MALDIPPPLFMVKSWKLYFAGGMVKAPHKWRSTFIMSSFRWKLACILVRVKRAH